MALLSMPARVCALSYELSVSESTETLRFFLDSPITSPHVRRTGTQQLFISLGSNAWQRETQPEPQTFPRSRLIRSIHPSRTGLIVTMATNAFGFIKLPTQGEQMTMQVFKDPIGARWKPRTGKHASPKPKRASKRPEPVKRSQASSKPVEIVSSTKPESISSEVKASVEMPRTSAQNTDQVKVDESSEVEAPVSAPSADDVGKEPFFSVPYAMRAPVKKVGPSKAETYSTDASPSQKVMLDEPQRGASVGESTSEPAGEVPEEEALQQDVSQPATGEPQVLPNATSPNPKVSSGPSLRMKAVKKTLKQMLADAEKGIGPWADKAEKTLAETVQDIGQEISEGGQLGEDITTGIEAGKVTEAENIALENATDEMMDNASLEGEVAPLDNATLRRMEIENQIDQATSLMMADNYQQAVEMLEPLLDDPNFPEKMREETLYMLASAKYQLYKDDLNVHFSELTSAYDRAINYNPKSYRVPEGLLNLGLINMEVGNIPEARAYFNILKKKYPEDDNVPFIEYYWGKYHFDRGEYRKAADRFQYLVQTFPDSKVVREAALGLANSLDELGYDKQAYQIIDYIDKRWPRYYVESPEFLRLSGNIANNLDKFEKAKNDYWTFYNLMPEAEDVDIILARIGDIYLREKKKQAAKDVYSFTAQNYPDSQGGLVSSMRLAEEGIYDDPDMKQMFTVFDRPYNVRPVEIYTKIVEKFPKSALAPLAQLKLAMWYMFNGQLEESMGAAQDFFGLYPKSSLAERALDVGLAAFEKSTAQAVAEQNYPRIIKTWEQHPFLQENVEKITPDSRMAVAVSYWKRDTPDKALALAKPFLKGDKQGKLSEVAVELALNIYLDRDAWNNIVTLGEDTADWELPEKLRFEVDYAQALALVNLGKMEKSRKIWAKLAAQSQSDPIKRAYALYYMARFAGEEGQLQKQYVFAQEGLALFLASGVDNQKVKDLLVMLMDATEYSGRLTDTLRWAVEYNSLIKKDAPDWPAFQYRLANIYRKQGDDGTWRKILENLIKEKPASLAARSARSDLQTQNLEEQARQFSSFDGQ